MTAHPALDNPDERADTLGTGANGSSETPAEELLALFGDEYTCDILTSLEEEPKPARALAEDCGMSRPTVYRRLNRLTDAGLVDDRLRIASDGNHRKEFHLVVSTVSFDLSEDGFAGYLYTSDRDIG
ncbi:transcriptional regulator TrmB [Halorubrum californiense DSM 19288]|uniref:Transcriptional regulator TrmB n=1 Tax=Halorubrum californiense DSM 19288 TaxID=1227465 RepID=M0ES11_9EURY|nr:winged helix-turn-helix domain-containing protein [Halorubrum californiense]ELZ49209.1 transcriptional regulator TrmB [Halorubrum californiense DSM 19288]